MNEEDKEQLHCDERFFGNDVKKVVGAQVRFGMLLHDFGFHQVSDFDIGHTNSGIDHPHDEKQF